MQPNQPIESITTARELAVFWREVVANGEVSPGLLEALKARAIEIGRPIVAQRTGIDRSTLSPVEAKIFDAVSAYLAVNGKGSYTLGAMKRHGLKEAVEGAVRRRGRGLKALTQANLAELSYEEIVLAHPTDFSPDAVWYARRNLSLPNEGRRPSSTTRNSDWDHDELVLALDLYLSFRSSPPGKTSFEVQELSSFLRAMAVASGARVSDTYRNPNGVYMKMMNLRSIDPSYTSDGKVGLSRRNELERIVWSKYAVDPEARARVIVAIRDRVPASVELLPVP